MQVYKGRGWSLAEDHINFTIGRQSFTLGQPENAVTAFREILTNDSRQTATQQGAFLREYLFVYKVTTLYCHVVYLTTGWSLEMAEAVIQRFLALLEQILHVCIFFQSVIKGNTVNLPQLPLPCIHSSATRVYFGHDRRLAEGKTQHQSAWLFRKCSMSYKMLFKIITTIALRFYNKLQF